MGGGPFPWVGDQPDVATSDSVNNLIKINNFISETEKSEQKGFVNLSKGLFGTFRNPTAHAPKIEWNMSEEDVLLFSKRRKTEKE